MTDKSGLIVARALSDEARLAALKALLERPHYAEELAQRLGLAASTAAFHLKKLEEAGLVAKTREQYYAVYTVRREALERPLLDLVTETPGDGPREEERLRAQRLKVLRAFVREGRVARLPVQLSKRRVVLAEFAALLEPGRDYPEPELNRLFLEHGDDPCTVRRELIGDGVLSRRDGIYRLERPAAAPSYLRSLEAAAPARGGGGEARRQPASPPGVYCVHNRIDGRLFIGRGSGVAGRLASQRAQLEWGGHRCAALQEDWRRLGPEAFTFEVLETLTGGEEDRFALAKLERKWLERLQPWGERGYHAPPRPPRN